MEGNSENLSDEDIARQVQDGNAEQFAILIRRYQAKMFRYANKFLLKDDTEDEVQEVFLKAYENIQSFKPDLKFSSWLYRIAHNQFINLIRKRSRFNLFDLDTLFPHPVAKETAEKETEANQVKKELEHCLEKLDPKYREVLVLHYLEELSYKEISDALKVPIATVGVRISRGKLALKKVYKQEFKKFAYE